jgi:glucose/arabinose dehydrogenase
MESRDEDGLQGDPSAFKGWSADRGIIEDFMTGFVVNDSSVWARPVGVAVADDGALLVSEDANGTIWRVSYSGGP